MRAKILNASAGSGKTYQLAYKYVHDVIERPESYSAILAVTFTNKATEEMKTRILKEINTLASGQRSGYMSLLRRETGLDEAEIRRRARTARTRILHNYSRFTVLTIDRFFQRILRAFIKEPVSYTHLDVYKRQNIDNVMRHLHLEAGVDGIISALDAPQSKPDPGCFLKAMEIEGATPDETLIFEDSAVGIEAARRSGAAYFVVKL